MSSDGRRSTGDTVQGVWRKECRGVHLQEIFLFSENADTGSGPHHPPVQGVKGLFFGGKVAVA
jgi:hypothetical protein